MAKIYWLASYPKSGNTWMRVLLTNYLRDSAAPVSINALEGGPIASARSWFDEWAGIEASELDDSQIERLRAGVYRCMAAEAPSPLYMKVHDRWGCDDRGLPLFPAGVTGGVVCILRNPLDLAASCANHWGVGLDETVERLCDPAFALARSLGGLSDQLRQRLGDWSSHVQSWLDDSGLPVHVVRYEDLHARPAEVFGEVVRFLGLPHDPARVEKAVAFSDFGVLQAQEQTGGFRERSAAAPLPFFRQGRVGGGKTELSPALRERLLAAHRPTMQRLGYLD